MCLEGALPLAQAVTRPLRAKETMRTTSALGATVVTVEALGLPVMTATEEMMGMTPLRPPHPPSRKGRPRMAPPRRGVDGWSTMPHRDASLVGKGKRRSRRS